MATYGGRNMVLEAMRGEISIRELRVALEHLPPGNAAQREIAGPWGDLEVLLHDVSSQLRLLNMNTYNINRKPGAQPITDPQFIPTPEQLQAEQEQRSRDQVEAERDHLMDVLRRKNPR